ncbi:MAG: thioredoxin domain-containing protein [Candidatus Methanoperedens sp.]|nr:thioredoxin domain-containing protein [Candidatus Methanoperedens sp.]
MNEHKKPNHLISEKSPYLIQHAYNPVDWYPWGQEAFDKAKREEKPIFLSIGYSTCHWCHVMEKESFENDQVAKLMNDAFVSIKVDREERPDLDGVYMSVCQRMTGSGGWPLNIILTPGKKPFYAATYIPKESRSGRIGMLEIVPRIKELWNANREGVEALSTQVISSLQEQTLSAREELSEDILHQAFEQLLDMFDESHGGFGNAPKFPTPHNLTFLLRYWKRTGDNMALQMVEKTLSQMHMGGIYDHVGFGFHRYSTDARWFVPHFEKMLYDQALLAMAYIEAYQATGKKEYEKTAREIITYVLRDMTSKDGGFYSGEDADSEGVEGKFYIWTEEDIDYILENESESIKKIYNVDKNGNFRDESTGKNTGKNILYLNKTIDELASGLKLTKDGIESQMYDARFKLFVDREKRPHPGKDDKVLTDWNGLMIAALAKGAQVFDEPVYAEAAQRAADFILENMRTPHLYHRYRDGETSITAFLDDYAFLTWGLIELYEATFKVQYLQVALELTDHIIKHFHDNESGGFFFTSDDAEELIYHKKEIYDGAVPSGNSAAMMNLLRLGKITANPEFEKKAEEVGRAFSSIVSQMPSAYTQLMSAIDFALGPTSEVVIAGDPKARDTKAMLSVLRREFIPNKIVILRDMKSEIENLAEFIRLLPYAKDKATAYVCRNYSCKLPTNDTEKMLELLNTSD